MPKRLFIHVGTHKTGSSSIQAMLLQNRKNIVQSGTKIFIEKFLDSGAVERSRINCFNLAHLFLRKEIMTGPRATGWGEKRTPDQEQQARRRFTTWLKAGPCDNIIISCETFCLLRTQHEYHLVQNCFNDADLVVTPLLFLRKDADWRASYRNQIEKRPQVAKAMVGLPDERQTAGDWYFDPAAIRGFWSQFGDIAEFDYDALMKDEGSVLPAFLRTTGLTDIVKETDYFLNKRVAL